MQYNFYIDPVTRRVTSEHMVVLWQDQNVTTIHFSLEDADGLSFVGASILIKAILPGGIPAEITPENFAVETNTTKDDEGNDVVIGYTTTFDWTLKLEHTQKVGQISYSICAILLDHTGEIIDKEWHTLNDSFAVLDHIHFDGSDDRDDPDLQATNAEKIAALKNTVSSINTRVNGLSSGAPPTADSTDDMDADVSTVYINTTDGNWYYYDGSAWQIGGVYGGAVTDTTLSISGAPADAKAVGDTIADFDIATSDDGAGTVIIQLVRGTV